MKAYKIEILVIDHDANGIDDTLEYLKRSPYVNPSIISHSQAEIGEWTDDHPLNNKTWRHKIKDYFGDN